MHVLWTGGGWLEVAVFQPAFAVIGWYARPLVGVRGFLFLVLPLVLLAGKGLGYLAFH